MATQRKWSSAKPRVESTNEQSRVEMLTKLKIFHDKFGTEIPPTGSDAEIVRDYYHKALEVIEDRSNENCNVLQLSLQEFVEDEDIDEEDPGREKRSCCTRFWEWICNICSCLSRVED
jgi:hypothetical protein